MNTVLIVDADPMQRNLVTRYLTGAGYCVLEAANPAEALRITRLCEKEIHLAVIANTDLVEVSKEIAAIRTTLPILVASDRFEDQAPSSSLPATVNIVYLKKPIIPVMLLDSIHGLLSRV